MTRDPVLLDGGMLLMKGDLMTTPAPKKRTKAERQAAMLAATVTPRLGRRRERTSSPLPVEMGPENPPAEMGQAEPVPTVMR